MEIQSYLYLDGSQNSETLSTFSPPHAKTPPTPTINTQTQCTVCLTLGILGGNDSRTSLHYLLAPSTLQTLRPLPKPQVRAHPTPRTIF